MGINSSDLREWVIRPTLQQLGDWSATAENILLGTAAQESQLGYRLQHHNGETFGLYNISADTHTLLWDSFLVQDPETASRLRGLASQQQFLKTPHHELATNLSYSTGVAWMIYKQHRIFLPESLSAYDLALYWQRYYCNRETPHIPTSLDQAKIDEYIANFRKFVAIDHKRMVA